LKAKPNKRSPDQRSLNKINQPEKPEKKEIEMIQLNKINQTEKRRLK